MKFQLLLITLFYCAYAPPPVVRVPSGSFSRLSSFGSIGTISSSGSLSAGSLMRTSSAPSVVNMARSGSGSQKALSGNPNSMQAKIALHPSVGPPNSIPVTIARHPSVGPLDSLPNFESRGITGQLSSTGSSAGSSTSVLSRNQNYQKLTGEIKKLLGPFGAAA